MHLSKHNLCGLLKIKVLPIFALIFLACVGTSFAQTISGKVISVADGDTITILDNSKKQHRIRLYGIDCPEKKQPFGKAAKKLTSSLSYRKYASVKVYDVDKYGRLVGVVTADNTNINQSIIENGLAWQYRKYCKEAFCSDWISLESKARNSRSGLWADNDPVAPWEWRKGKRNSSYVSSNNGKHVAATGGYHGNVKSHVYHSSSCRWFNCKNCVKRFSSKEEAEAAGYTPCRKCN